MATSDYRRNGVGVSDLRTIYERLAAGPEGRGEALAMLEALTAGRPRFIDVDGDTLESDLAGEAEGLAGRALEEARAGSLPSAAAFVAALASLLGADI